MGRIIRQLNAELFDLIRLPSRKRRDKSRIMAIVLPLGPSLGKPKKLLEQNARYDAIEPIPVNGVDRGTTLVSSPFPGHDRTRSFRVIEGASKRERKAPRSPNDRNTRLSLSYGAPGK